MGVQTTCNERPAVEKLKWLEGDIIAKSYSYRTSNVSSIIYSTPLANAVPISKVVDLWCISRSR